MAHALFGRIERWGLGVQLSASGNQAALPRVSVIIAAYNSELFIERAIGSALAQGAVTVETIVVDDASTDGTAALVRRLAASEARLRLLELGRNQGPSAARNAGLEAAAGDWAAVLDADDAFLPGRLAFLVAAAERANADIVADGFRYYDASSGEIGRHAIANVPPEQVLDLPMFVAGARPYGGEADFGLLKPVFRLAFLRREAIRYPDDVRHGEDFELIFKALLRGARYLLCRTSFYLYTTRSSGQSRTRLDYSDQIRRTGILAREHSALGLGVTRLLRHRARALGRLQLQSEIDLLRKRKSHAGLLYKLLGSVEGWRWMGYVAGKRLRRG